MSNTINLPSLLSFERKLETSDALMYSGSWSDISSYKNDKDTSETDNELLWRYIKISPRFNRSTQSAHGIKDVDKTKPNPVSSGNDDANLPEGKDTLKVSFTLRVIGNLGVPFACNDPDFEKKIKDRVKDFKGDNGEGLNTLSYRYAYNIANGRFLWRNRVGVNEIKIDVFINNETTPLTFNPYDYSLKDFNKNSSNESLQELSDIIQTGFNSEDDFVFIKVDAYVRLGERQHVFPSEEMNMGEKGKTLFKLGECAAMHNVKIGNALRTIDDWYNNDVIIKDDKKTKNIKISDEDIRPIAIEPYGSVTQRGSAYRAKKDDLYTLMLDWLNKNDNPLSDNDKNYVVANLVRGGVFSRKSS